ncbi:MAG: hypothetical protein AAB740_00350 [Patescibacteria group bacterium]
MLAQSTSGFGISSYTQELMCYVGQQMVFEEGSEMFNKMKGVNISGKQIERVCHHYGGIIEEENQQLIETQQSQTYTDEERNKLHYVMVDGSMYLTREEKWKEAKLGRVFKAEDDVAISYQRNMITTSTYIAHLGNQKEFFPKLEYHIDELRSLAIIADGAKYIWSWADTFYPDATQILDFFHAKEHLCAFAINYFKDTQEREQWIECYCKIMMEDDAGKVIKALEKLPKVSDNAIEKQKQTLIRYYRANLHRMRYSTFKKRGLLIGSGPIEAAHRNVLQQRMKLSGQRWTKKGFQQVANLRVVKKSNQWNRISELIKKAA